jgi:pyridoxine 5-phosphate synthase
MSIFAIRLGVNIDHVATLRQARGTLYPDPVQAAFLAQQAGADLITVHLREDRRHIQERDVRLLKEVLQIPLNLEMAATESMLKFAEEILPQHCCIVPEKRQELTTEGGLNVLEQESFIADLCAKLKSFGIQVSLFIDADIRQIDAAKRCNAPIIELHTGQYAEAESLEQAKELRRIQEAATYAQNIGLKVHAGHGLHYQNVQNITAIPEILELNIGHSIVAQALFVGFERAVSDMKKLMVEARLMSSELRHQQLEIN